jgi:hypothetical protein
VPIFEDGRWIVRYFTDAATADTELARYRRGNGTERAGAWLHVDPDFDWEEFADELDRVRHESAPTPPIDLDDP